jgi:hypothetical protein
MVIMWSFDTQTIVVGEYGYTIYIEVLKGEVLK